MKYKIVFVCFVLHFVIATAQAQGPLQADLKAQFTKQLDEIAANLKGVIGYRVVDLTTGEQVAARLEKEPFPTASTIKLSILYEMFKQNEAGTLPAARPTTVSHSGPEPSWTKHVFSSS